MGTSNGSHPKWLEPYLGTLPVGSTMRLVCPRCYGETSLGLSRKRGEMVWHCFRASCGFKGRAKIEASAGELREMLSECKRVYSKDTFTLPSDIIKGIPNEQTYKYLKANHSLEAILKGYASCGYDPVRNRVVFYNELMATGRALKKSVKPKWYVYPGSLTAPFIVGKGSTAVLVEDCASACSIGISPNYTGIALRGTEYFSEYTKYIAGKFERIIIALDKDASKKALPLRDMLTINSKDVRVWLLSDDLKYIDCSDNEALNNIRIR